VLGIRLGRIRLIEPTTILPLQLAQGELNCAAFRPSNLDADRDIAVPAIGRSHFSFFPGSNEK